MNDYDRTDEEWAASHNDLARKLQVAWGRYEDAVAALAIWRWTALALGVLWLVTLALLVTP